jgi:hypothetical protein
MQPTISSCSIWCFSPRSADAMAYAYISPGAIQRVVHVTHQTISRSKWCKYIGKRKMGVSGIDWDVQ